MAFPKDGDPAGPNRATAPAVLSQLHQAAYDQRVAFGIGLWDRIPPAIAVRIVEAGISIQDVDFSALGDPIVMDPEGNLHLCSTHGLRAVRASDGHWGDL